MSRIGTFLVLGFGFAGIVYAYIIGGENLGLSEPASDSMDEVSETTYEGSKLDLSIHAQEVFFEARVDLHDGK